MGDSDSSINTNNDSITCFCNVSIDKTLYALREHRKMCRFKYRICRECFCIFGDFKLLRLHQKEFNHQKRRKIVSLINKSSDVYLFECDAFGCNKCYKTLSLLNLHKKAHSKPFKCFCGKSFTRNNDLQRHKETHSNNDCEAQFIFCTFCKETFCSKSSLKKHIDSIHQSASKQFVCRKCCKQFRRKDELQSHFKSHLTAASKKVYDCKTCHTSFSTKSNRTKHMKKSHLV